MPAIFLTEPLHIVEVGPMPGAYFSRAAYEEILKRAGITYHERVHGQKLQRSEDTTRSLEGSRLLGESRKPTRWMEQET